jgi:pimeloyl-ACP methyl ester carboxylesterase
MPQLRTNGIQLAYQRAGRGETVLFVMGASAGGRVWTLHQTPAIVGAGYEAVTFDNRGIPPSDVPPGEYSLSDMVADTGGLIEALDLAPCRVVGASLGAMITQELMVERPELVRCAVLIATKARSDVTREALSAAYRALAESGIRLPPAYEAAMSVVQMLSRSSLDDDRVAALWLEIFELSGDGNAARGQNWADITGDYRKALQEITVPCRVISFADDLITPPHLGAEVAEAIPDCDLLELPGCGHLGFLERPEEVNSAIIEFLGEN